MADNGTPETDQQNADGKKGGGGEIVAALVGAAATAAIGLITNLGGSLFGDRSVVVEISNNTQFTLRKKADHHESGGFHDPPPPEIAPRTTGTFTSENGTPVEGTVGSVTYTIDGFDVLFGWNNPRFGSNGTNTSRDGINKSRFLVMHQTGSGNKSAHMKYFLFIHPDYFVKESLKEKGDLSKGIKSLNLRPGASVISVRDLVDF